MTRDLINLDPDTKALAESLFARASRIRTVAVGWTTPEAKARALAILRDIRDDLWELERGLS